MVIRVIEFVGARGGVGPLTWGQRHIWDAIHRLGESAAYLNLRYVVGVPAGCPLDHVLTCLRQLVERHEALRTLYRDENDGPEQVVVRTGTVAVEIRQADSDGAALVASISDELSEHGFDSGRELPVRFAVVVRQARPLTVVMVLSHQSVDGTSGRALAGSLARALTVPRPPSWSSDESQPLDQAWHEQTAAVGRRSRLAVEYWMRGLRQAAWSAFDAPRRSTDDHRYVRYRLDSPTVAAACPILAATHRVSSSTVLLTAMLLLLNAYTGHSRIPVQLIAGNRLGSRHRGLVSTLAQDALHVADLAGLGFGHAVQATYDASILAYRHGYYDPVALQRRRAELEHQRGVAFDLSVLFNDARGQREPTADRSSVQATRPVAPPAAGQVSFVGSWPRHDCKFFLHVDDAVGDCQLYLLTDTAYLPRAETVAFLHGLEGLLARAVARDLGPDEVADMAGLPPLSRGDGWVRHGPGWVHPDAVRRVLAEAAGTSAVAVVVDGPPAGDRPATLVGYVAEGRLRQLSELHAAVVGRLAGHTDAVAPNLYVLCDSAPRDRADIDQWRAVPVLAAGDGRGPAVPTAVRLAN